MDKGVDAESINKPGYERFSSLDDEATGNWPCKRPRTEFSDLGQFKMGGEDAILMLLVILAVLLLLDFSHLHLISWTSSQAGRQELTTSANWVCEGTPLFPFPGVPVVSVKSRA